MASLHLDRQALCLSCTGRDASTMARRASPAPRRTSAPGPIRSWPRSPPRSSDLPVEKIEVVLGDTTPAGGTALGRLDGHRLGRSRGMRRRRERPLNQLTGDRYQDPRVKARTGANKPAELTFRDGRGQARERRRCDALSRLSCGRPSCRASREGESRRAPLATRIQAGIFHPLLRRSFRRGGVAAGDRPAPRESRRHGRSMPAGILNPLAGRNQIEGAVVMGIGMALFEETQYEHAHRRADQFQSRRLHRGRECRRPADRRPLPRPTRTKS